MRMKMLFGGFFHVFVVRFGFWCGIVRTREREEAFFVSSFRTLNLN